MRLVHVDCYADRAIPEEPPQRAALVSQVSGARPASASTAVMHSICR